MQSSSLGYKVSVGVKHYIAKEDRWEDKGEVDLPKSMVEKFIGMLKRVDPGSLEKIS